jgi:hypothetical protein
MCIPLLLWQLYIIVLFVQVWKGETDTDPDEEDDGEEEEGDDDEEGDESDDDDPERVEESKTQVGTDGRGRKGKQPQSARAEMQQLRAHLGVDEANRTPLANESLREFFSRTSTYWTTEAVPVVESEIAANGSTDARVDVKALRRRAFAMAEARYQVEQPLIRMNQHEIIAYVAGAAAGSGTTEHARAGATQAGGRSRKRKGRKPQALSAAAFFPFPISDNFTQCNT